ncbi:hypothetical protein [Rhodothalassium salexigens]|uniref:hypothetical protein n=1 Tax=Rhodothalassium salexigens TaxID=1086 RepID=UPI00104A6657|nr:hypothetical protein [Rhodothalassium salexigens]MBB4211212.1 hypothetical protein [Rhodothalassium salexigens DSM 2132]
MDIAKVSILSAKDKPSKQSTPSSADWMTRIAKIDHRPEASGTGRRKTAAAPRQPGDRLKGAKENIA